MMAVVLPQPDSPTSPSVSRSRMSKLMPSTACTVPMRRRIMPFFSSGKCLTRSWTASTVARVSRDGASASDGLLLHRKNVGARHLLLFDFVAAMARRAVRRIVSLDRQQRRLHLQTLLDAQRAPRPEWASRRQMHERRRVSVDWCEPLPSSDVEPRNRSQQSQCVRHPRPIEHVVHIADFDDAPRVHHRDTVGEAGHDAEVVRDQDDRRSGRLFGRLEHVQNLRLDRDVERGRRLVGDDHVGLIGHRHRNHDALAHAARKLVRKRRGASRGVRDSRERQQLDGARMRRLSRHVVVSQNRLRDLIADRVHRRECRQRVLENHRDAPAPNLRQLPIAQSYQVALAKANRSRHACVRRQQAHDRQRRNGLARPRLADDSQHFAGANLIRDAAHGRPRPPPRCGTSPRGPGRQGLRGLA